MDDYKELIERLRYERDDGSRNEAADAIKSLLEENERLERNLIFLDGLNLGCITLDQAMKTYRAQDVICSGDGEPIKLIVKPGEEK